MFGAVLIFFFYAQATLAHTFQLKIEIAPNQVTLLKNLSYKLCIAKKVNGNYNIVWSANQQYFQNNHFQWQELYQVFGTGIPEEGIPVSPLTNIVDIANNQTSILTLEGVMQPATGPISPSGPFFVNNKFGVINIGINSLFGETFLPIYVSPTIIVSINKYQPIPAVLLWFALNQTTSTIFFDMETVGIEVVYNGTTNATISYSGPDGHGIWSPGPLPPLISASSSSNPTSTTGFKTSSTNPVTTSAPNTSSTSVNERRYWLN